jgi:hypothetical protein
MKIKRWIDSTHTTATDRKLIRAGLDAGFTEWTNKIGTKRFKVTQRTDLFIEIRCEDKRANDRGEPYWGHTTTKAFF